MDHSSPPSSPPPQYTPTASSQSPFATPFLTAHLQSLPSRLRASHAAHASARDAADLYTVSLLTPHIERFLDDVVASSRQAEGNISVAGREAAAALSAELVLVPKAAVRREKGWVLADAKERRREGEVIRVVRVGFDNDEESGDKKHDASSRKKNSENEPALSEEREWDESREFTSWGRWKEDGEDAEGEDDYGLATRRRSTNRSDDDDEAGLSAAGSSKEHQPTPLLWWRDEAAARRLASYLQPKAPPPPAEKSRSAAVISTVQTAVSPSGNKGREKEKEEKRSGASGWGGLGGFMRRRADKEQPQHQYQQPPKPVAAAPSEKAREAGLASPSTLTVDGGGSTSSGGNTFEHRVSMTVRAQEVTFRRENEFGIYESLSGPGIVVTVRIRRA